jgi:hypothetical protein
MTNVTKTRLGRLEARQRPDTLDIAIVASQVEADSVVEDALNAGRPRPTVIVTGVAGAPDAGPTWLSLGKLIPWVAANGWAIHDINHRKADA